MDKIYISLSPPLPINPPPGFRLEWDGQSNDGDWSCSLGAPSGCWLSDDGTYRALLWRTFHEGGGDFSLSHRPPLVFGMMNPSTATHLVLDNTVRRCIGYARRERAGGIIVVNRSPFRATYQRDLEAAHRRGLDVLMWERNLEAWYVAAKLGTVLVAAWGTPNGTWWKRAQERRTELLLPFAGRAVTIGEPAKSGEPKHPLYLRKNALFLPFAA